MTFTEQRFVAGAQKYINELEAAGILYSTKEIQRECEVCWGGGGCGFCNRGQVDILVVTPDPNARPCNCGSGQRWVDCKAAQQTCG